MASWAKVAGGGRHADRSRNDYYPTPPAVTRALLRVEEFPGPILEPCAGRGHVVRVLEEAGYDVCSGELHPMVEFPTDYLGDWLDPSTYYGPDMDMVRDCRSVVTNPPYRWAEGFIRAAIERGIEKHAWLLRFQFVEGAGRRGTGGRYDFFRDHPPRRLWTFSKRVQVSERGLENPVGGMIVYAWWVWERGYDGAPELRWFPPDAAVDNGTENR